MFERIQRRLIILMAIFNFVLSKHNAKDSTFRDYPFQVVLIGKKETEYYPNVFCSGTLLNRLWILTAAHCTQNIQYFYIYMGRQRSYELIMRSSNFIGHEKFIPSTAVHDIALIKLPQAINYTKAIRPAMLPFVRRHDQFSGLRAVSISTDWHDDSVKVLDMFVISNKACSYEYNVVTAGILCARTVKHEVACLGDSGGPLVLKDTQLVIGIISFGPLNFCDITKPNGFTRITFYLDWIIMKISQY